MKSDGEIRGRRRSSKVSEGDIFEIPIPDGRRGYGQVIVGGKVFYIAVFRGLHHVQPDLGELIQDDILLVGWTVDALIYHGEWKIVGNRPPTSPRVPFPSYKVLVNGRPCTHDFNGDNFRPATPRDLELLENKTTVAPIRYQNALLAFHGFGEWRSDYNELTAQHARHRVLGDIDKPPLGKH